MFERRLYHHIDWVLIGAVLAICAIGLAMIYSTTGGAGRVYWTQVYALGLGPDRDGVSPSASTTARSPTSRTGSISRC